VRGAFSPLRRIVTNLEKPHLRGFRSLFNLKRKVWGEQRVVERVIGAQDYGLDLVDWKL